MSAVRVLVGTRKGAFVLTSDGARKEWSVDGPHFAGWEVFHMKGSPADPDRIYAAPNGGGWFGQVIQRSDDGGKTWNPVGNEFKYAGEAGTHQWYDGTPHPWEFARVWHLEPAREDPDTVYAGVEDAALFRSTDGGKTWRELPGLRGHGTGSSWQPGAGGLCLHTILLDPQTEGRIYTAISAAGAFRSDDNGESWREISGNLPSDFGFPIEVHPAEPETIYVVPIKSDSEHYPPDAMAVDTLDACGVYFGTTGGQVYASPDAGDTWAPIVRDLPAVLSVEVRTLP